MFGAINDLYLWKVRAQAIHDRIRIRIHNNLRNLRNGQQCLDDVMEQWLSGKDTIIFARHALTMMAHRDKSDRIDHDSKNRLAFNESWVDIDLEQHQNDTHTDTQNN